MRHKRIKNTYILNTFHFAGRSQVGTGHGPYHRRALPRAQAFLPNRSPARLQGSIIYSPDTLYCQRECQRSRLVLLVWTGIVAATAGLRFFQNYPRRSRLVSSHVVFAVSRGPKTRRRPAELVKWRRPSSEIPPPEL